MLLVLLLAVLLLRLLAAGLTPLVPEEAYYWVYAQHPSLSYYDHPPMVAWVIKAGTAVFGISEFGVRIAGMLLMLGSSVLAYRLGRDWYGRRVGLLCALLLQVLPFYYFTGFIATMDSPLVFFWLLCLVGLTQALKCGNRWGWYVAGLGLGGALLSKYSAIFLGAGIPLVLILEPRWRRHLFSVHPWLAMATGLALFSPVLVWNARHAWASFHFQFVARYAEGVLNPVTPAVFAGFQLLVLTPLPLFVLIWAWTRLAKTPSRLLRGRWLLSWAFSAPLLATAIWKALRFEVHINWTAPVYLGALPLLAFTLAAVLRRSARRGRRATGKLKDAPLLRWPDAVGTTLLLCLLFNLAAMTYLLLLEPRLRALGAFGPWRELAAMAEREEDRLEKETGREPLVVGDGKYRLASEIAFYRAAAEPGTAHDEVTTSQWIVSGSGLGFKYWLNRADWVGRDCIFVARSGEFPRLTDHFESVRMIELPAIATRHRYEIAICRGLRESVASKPKTY